MTCAPHRIDSHPRGAGWRAGAGANDGRASAPARIDIQRGFGLRSLSSDVIELARGGTTLVEQQQMAFSVADVLQSVLDIYARWPRKSAYDDRVGPPADTELGTAGVEPRVLNSQPTRSSHQHGFGGGHMPRAGSHTDRVLGARHRARHPRMCSTTCSKPFVQRQVPGDYAFSSAGTGLIDLPAPCASDGRWTWAWKRRRARHRFYSRSICAIGGCDILRAEGPRTEDRDRVPRIHTATR